MNNKKQPYTLKYFSAFCAEGSAVKEELVRVSERVSLRAFKIKPAQENNNPLIIFVPGWITQPVSWKNVLAEITKDFPVIYVETREKRGGLTKGEKDFSIYAMSEDLINVIKYYNPGQGGFVLFGSSLGASLILHSAKNLSVKPKALVLIAPNAEFKVPFFWKMIITFFYPPLYFLIKPPVKWYLRKFRMNIEKDRAQYEKYANAIDAADPWKLKRAVMSLWKYKIWNSLKGIDIPCLFIGGSHDKLHEPESTKLMIDIIPESVYLDMKTNSATHSKEMVYHLREFLQQGR
ncbi:alpha/beta hydrolase [bacterium]|nr:alpha/beta hydrolase [bacterium]